MRKVTFILLFICYTSSFFSQNATIAKLKFEEAEEEYAKGNFDITLGKLKEVEAILKSTNPKCLYLKILATYQFIKQPIFRNDSKLISQLTADCNFYLQKHESLPNNEEKYREIYKVSEDFKKYKYDEATYKKAKSAQLEKGISYFGENKFDLAFVTIEKIANQGDPEAIVMIGNLYKVNKDYSNAEKWYEFGVSNNERSSMAALADFYIDDDNTEKKPDQAISLHKKAAELGYLMSMFRLGQLNIEGKYIPINVNIALEWYTKVMKADLKNNIDSTLAGHACQEVAYMYHDGKPFEKNYIKAEEYALKGREIKSGGCLNLLGEIYRDGGYGITLDYVKSFKYFSESYHTGDIHGTINLARMHKEGLGTKKDKKTAEYIRDKVVEEYQPYVNMGEPLAAEILIELYTAMDDISMVNYWRAKAKELEAKREKK